jgi:hypothetical protein
MDKILQTTDISCSIYLMKTLVWVYIGVQKRINSNNYRIFHKLWTDNIVERITTHVNGRKRPSGDFRPVKT